MTAAKPSTSLAIVFFQQVVDDFGAILTFELRAAAGEKLLICGGAWVGD